MKEKSCEVNIKNWISAEVRNLKGTLLPPKGNSFDLFFQSASHKAIGSSPRLLHEIMEICFELIS